MDRTTRFLNACARRPVDRPPVWLMRQAGRYMASYQAVRRKVSFMELCRTPELACEVTMQPMEQLGVDAAILFSDILVPLEPMGMKVYFDGGPQVEPAVRTSAHIDALRSEGVADDLGYVYEAIGLIKKSLPENTPLLGFAGAPWTLASYLIEGSSSRNCHELKRMMYAEPEALDRLLNKLAKVVADFLQAQIAAGCDAVQLFDSWGGILDAPTWCRFSRFYTAKVIEALKPTGVPIIHFAKGAHLVSSLAELNCDVLSVDWTIPLGDLRRRLGGSHALQGNIDPGVLRAPIPVIREAVRTCLDDHGPEPGHILNLGHGITPDVTVETVKALVDAAKELGPQYGSVS
jgi:uroporphyrinogen decarboxylase